MRRALAIFATGLIALAAACGSGDDPTATSAAPTATVSGSNVGPDGAILPEPQPEIALEAALEAISGFEITSVVFRGNDVTVKYDRS